MKKFLAFALISLFAALGAFAQSTTTTFTVTVVAPPSCTITLAANPVSTSGTKLYAGQAGTINFNISACPSASSAATASWDGAALTVIFTPANGSAVATLAAAVTTAQASVGSHTLILTIPPPVLSLVSPVPLPNGTVGTPYSASLGASSHLSGGIPPYKFALAAGSLPVGLSLSSAGVVSGTPSGAAGTSNFDFTVTDSSGLTILIHAQPTLHASTKFHDFRFFFV